MAKIYSDVEQLIGGTPLIRLNRFVKNLDLNADILAKVEFFNPGGSVKDRAAKAMIDEAEKDGTLKPGAVIIEPTSGNTGIGLALVAALRGYKAMIVMPDTMSPERIKLMKAYGADVVLTPGKEGMAGAIAKAEELKKENPGSIIAGQFENPANANAHYVTTGPEVYYDTNGKVDVVVCGIGTGGTITGIGRYLKKKIPGVKVIGVEPQNSPYLTEKRAGSHKIQGIGAGFVPKVLDETVIDEIITVGDEAAYAYARLLAKDEGLLVGISSGAALCATANLARREEYVGKTIVVILPDSGSRYLSGDLFE